MGEGRAKPNADVRFVVLGAGGLTAMADAAGMKHDDAVATMAVLIIGLLIVHLSADVVYGYEPARVITLTGVPIAALWLYATLVLAGRRAGYFLLLLGAFLAAGVAVIHMSGNGVRADVVNSNGGFFFILTLFALAMSASVAFLTSIHGLWRLKASALGFILWTLVCVAAGAGLFYFLFYAPKMIGALSERALDVGTAASSLIF